MPHIPWTPLQWPDSAPCPLSQLAIRRTLRELMQLSKGRLKYSKIKPDADDRIPVDEIPCAHCRSVDCDSDNDIVMCDRKGCFRAYHQHCQNPPITREEIANDEAVWYCRQCACIIKCYEEINRQLDEGVAVFW